MSQEIIGRCRTKTTFRYEQVGNASQVTTSTHAQIHKNDSDQGAIEPNSKQVSQ